MHLGAHPQAQQALARKARGRVRVAVLALALLAGAGGTLLWARQGREVDATPADARRVLQASLEPEALHGADRLTGEAVTMPVTIALIAGAAASLADKVAAVTLADRLLAAATKPGRGWGLGFPFDAFSDGSVSPRDAIYGADTALAVGSLLDALELTREARYRDAAVEALEHYRGFAVRNAKGLFMAYSDQPEDRIPVYATAALLMGQYARAGALSSRPELTAFADELFRSLWSEKWETELGAAWPYSAQNPFWNDAANAGAIGFGIAVYAKHRPVPAIDLAAVERYLRSFVREDKVLEFAPHAKLRPKLLRPAPVNGIGMLMGALAEFGDCDSTRAIAGRLGPYRLPGGRFGYLPKEPTYYPRAHAHVVWGLAGTERACPHGAPGASG
jgi:hypothetical protein